MGSVDQKLVDQTKLSKKISQSYVFENLFMSILYFIDIKISSKKIVWLDISKTTMLHKESKLPFSLSNLSQCKENIVKCALQITKCIGVEGT
jgi:transglutaminase/protease-like cytokinesis protein 3